MQKFFIYDVVKFTDGNGLTFFGKVSGIEESCGTVFYDVKVGYLDFHITEDMIDAKYINQDVSR